MLQLLHSKPEDLEASPATSTSTKFSYDFSRILVHASGHNNIQPKLKMDVPNDIYEQEADRVAEEMMGVSEPLVASGNKNCEKNWLIGVSRRATMDIQPRNSKAITRNAIITVCNSYTNPVDVTFAPVGYFLPPTLRINRGNCDRVDVIKPKNVPATNFSITLNIGGIQITYGGFTICK